MKISLFFSRQLLICYGLRTCRDEGTLPLRFRRYEQGGARGSEDRDVSPLTCTGQPRTGGVRRMIEASGRVVGGRRHNIRARLSLGLFSH